MHVRKLCEYASGSLSGLGEGESAITLIRLDKQKTLTLVEFMDEQKDQGAVALKQLNSLRENIIDLVWESCAVSYLSDPVKNSSSIIYFILGIPCNILLLFIHLDRGTFLYFVFFVSPVKHSST